MRTSDPGRLVMSRWLVSGCARRIDDPHPTSTNTSATATPRRARTRRQPAARTTLLGNLGSYHRAITTPVRRRRQFFDEGLTLLYGFNHEEAFRSFERAAALDPKAPMPHWGMSLALGTNYNDTATPDRLQQAHAHLTHAQQRAANGSEVERAFIDALAKRYVATPDDGNQPEREKRLRGGDGRGLEAVPRRSRCGDALRREHDEPAAVEALHVRRRRPSRAPSRSSRRSRA